MISACQSEPNVNKSAKVSDNVAAKQVISLDRETVQQAIDKTLSHINDTSYKLMPNHLFYQPVLENRFEVDFTENITFDSKKEVFMKDNTAKYFLKMIDKDYKIPKTDFNVLLQNLNSTSTSAPKLLEILALSINCTEKFSNKNSSKILKEINSLLNNEGFYLIRSSALALNWLNENQCIEKKKLQDLKDRSSQLILNLCENKINEVDNNNNFSELLLLISLLYNLEQDHLINKSWIEYIITKQEKNGAWKGNLKGKRTDLNTALYALWVLNEYLYPEKNGKWIN